MKRRQLQISLLGNFTRTAYQYTYKDNLVICERQGSIIQIKKDCVLIQTDVTGIDKVYVEINNNKIRVSNIFKDFIHNNINETFIKFQKIKGYIPYPFTILNNVIKTPPGIITKFYINKMGKVIHEYYPSEELKIFDKDSKLNKLDFRTKFTKLLLNNYKNKTLVSSFSGGFDSLLLTSIYKDKCKQIIHFVDDKTINISVYKKQFSNCKWTIIDNSETFSESDKIKYFKCIDEPNCDSAGFAEYLMIKKLINDNSTIKLTVMNGQACDGIFANGRVYFQEFVSSQAPKYIKKIITTPITNNKLLNKIRNYFTDTDKRFMNLYLGTYKFPKDTQMEIYRVYNVYKDEISNDSTNIFAACTITLKYSLHGIEKIKTAAHAFNTEYYLPFLSKNIIKYAFSISSKDKVGFKLGKQILIKSYPEISNQKFITKGFQPELLKERFIGEKLTEKKYTNYYTKKWIKYNIK
jgi:asparagine synthetase B (glutamine-hydrolysing)